MNGSSNGCALETPVSNKHIVALLSSGCKRFFISSIQSYCAVKDSLMKKELGSSHLFNSAIYLEHCNKATKSL